MTEENAYRLAYAIEQFTNAPRDNNWLEFKQLVELLAELLP